MREAFTNWNPRADALTDIDRAEQICREYATQGYDLTLRQLYYQFVARAWIPNNMRSYKRLGDIVNNARLSGRLDWRYIVDRTRNLSRLSSWTSPSSIIESAAYSYHIDLWSDQPTRVEVWVEKEALAGVVQRVADRWDCAWFSCRGYVSQSEMYYAAQRLQNYVKRSDQDVLIIHLGDHDPSGLDMTRDISDRLALFMGGDSFRLTVDRIALNMDQIQQYQPPPNPAKTTDSRAAEYIAEYGEDSWELDALDPATLNGLIDGRIAEVVDADLYANRRDLMEDQRRSLQAVSDNWPAVSSYVEGLDT